MPFMARFRQVYLTSYLIGEGLSGLLPSLFALAQGVGGNPQCRNSSSGGGTEAFYPPPRFSVEVFFFILTAMMAACAVAFLALNYCRPALNERTDDGTHTTWFPSQVKTDDTDSDLKVARSPIKTDISRSVLVYLMCLQAWVCCLSNGFLPSIQSYSCLPYGNMAYHLAVTLSAMANPLACLAAYFLPITNVCLILIVAMLGTSVSCYIIALAALSPAPPLVDFASGEALMVCR